MRPACRLPIGRAQEQQRTAKSFSHKHIKCNDSACKKIKIKSVKFLDHTHFFITISKGTSHNSNIYNAYRAIPLSKNLKTMALCFV